MQNQDILSLIPKNKAATALPAYRGSTFLKKKLKDLGTSSPTILLKPFTYPFTNAFVGAGSFFILHIVGSAVLYPSPPFRTINPSELN